MVKSVIELFILKSYVPFQSCCCPVQKSLPRRAELAWLVSRYLWRGTWNFKITFSRPLFTIILSKKWSFQDLRFWSTYSSRSRWCEMDDPLFIFRKQFCLHEKTYFCRFSFLIPWLYWNMYFTSFKFISVTSVVEFCRRESKGSRF